MATPSVSLSAPYTVFPLSLPLHQTKAKGRNASTYRACYTAPVESRKRKRPNGSTEIATAVDGEGVNIYDVRSTQTVSSYALQPSTKFSCAPTSTVSRLSKTGVFRRTYAALSAPKKQLVCWEETADGSDEQDTPVKQHSANSGSKHDVVFIQDLSSTARRGKAKDEEVDSGLLVVYTDGMIRMFDRDLQKTHWEFALLSQKTEDSVVVYAASASTATVCKSVLSSRSDIALSEGNEHIILLIVTQDPTASTVHLISVPVTANRKTPRDLLSIQLPASSKHKSAFSVHFPTGTLYQLSSTHLTTYNLAATNPTAVTIVPLPWTEDSDAHPKSLLRISSSIVLVATNDEIALYDTKFSSLQASVSIKQPTSNAVSGVSTPTSSAAGTNSTDSVFLTTFIQDMDLVIGYAQSGIVGIQLTRSRAEAKGGLLIDSIGRGVSGADDLAKVKTTFSTAHERRRVRTESALQALRRAKNSGDVTRFEYLFGAYLGSKRLIHTVKPAEGGEDTAMVNGVEGSALDKENATSGPPDFSWAIAKLLRKPLRADFVRGVLSMIFEVTEPSPLEGEQEMRVGFAASNALRFLLETGNFSTTFLPLKHGLMKALLAYDPTLCTLQLFLTSLNDLPVAEFMAALELTLSPTTSSPEGEDGDAFEIRRAEVIRMTCVHLSSLPASTIVNAFKSLSSDTLILLIRLLENELLCEETDEPGKTIGLDDPRMITDLLTCGLDAVGMSGLIMTETNEVLEGLKESVDEALELMQEATELKGLMEEMFRHVDWRKIADLAVVQEGKAREQEERAAAARKKLEEKKAAASLLAIESQQAGKAINQQPVTAVSKRETAIYRAALQRLGSQRRVLGHKKMWVLGHKKMSGLAAVSRSDIIKQTQPVALSSAQQVSSILPLGVSAARRVATANLGKEWGLEPNEKAETKSIAKRRQYFREGLAAGSYSVETMVV
ncbi:hypothetical protein FN846DRAFT_925194 [Sphaerosporella brunnea]|uniref:Uncharacterized protein n=1 Tax=Sphaerosporella brunnea TaxID=1250544 RepID=A0A5J5FCM5_9PEZI|nr:hypothetical protein FN846DRAFT_925194 [Sphaerosporella brunnea]